MFSQPGWWWPFAVFVGLFLVWTGVGVGQLIFAVPSAAVVATIRYQMAQREGRRVRLVGLVQFIPYFLFISFRGGIDMARRSMMPSMPLEPGFVDYQLRIDPEGAAAVFFGATISLVPGTLCVEIGQAEHTLVHLVDTDAGFEDELQRLERRVAAVFGEPLNERDNGQQGKE